MSEPWGRERWLVRDWGLEMPAYAEHMRWRLQLMALAGGPGWGERGYVLPFTR